MGTQRYVLGKILQALLTLFFILDFNFFLFRVMPGDPVETAHAQRGRRALRGATGAAQGAARPPRAAPDAVLRIPG